MEKWIIATLCVVFSVFLILIGRQFRRGKCLRMLAGNSFNDLPKEQVAKTGKLTALFLFLIALDSLLVAFYILSNKGKMVVVIMTGCILVASVLIFIRSMVQWLKIKY